MAIETTGQLRKLLADVIEQVRAGDIGLDEASRITKLAAQVNESFYSEMKVAQVMQACGEAASELGKLRID